MRLVWLTLHGYKRFAAAAKLNLDSRLIAITGPNEAGKSSLLDALMHLNHDEPLAASELTRRTTVPEDQRILRAEFLLESADIQAIRHLNGGGNARWFRVTKLQSGEVRTGVEPQLTRDLRPRARAVTALRP